MTGPIAAALDRGPVRVLLVGMGVANRAVAGALLRRGHRVVAVDDSVDETLRAAASTLGLEVVESPDREELDGLVGGADLVCPAPGLPEHHPVFDAARDAGRPLISEFDLAAAWDDRPVVAITGTNGKTTVVELAVDALLRSGIEAVAAGNTDLPLVAAIDEPGTAVFVVEASSFRLARASEFAPRVGLWLNFAPDHLDIHADLRAYENAKAALFTMVPDDGVIVANAADPVVSAHIPVGRTVVTFGTETSDWRLEGEKLVGPEGVLTTTERLWRDLPHDIEDALAVAAAVTPVGGDTDAIAVACENFRGLSHRVTPVGEVAGSVFYDDSKATTPHATLAALRGFDRVVLIAGGRNKGIDLRALTEGGDAVAAVVAIGEAATEIVEAFEETHEVAVARDMEEAVRLATDFAGDGTPVLLSPGCASFDWYRSYGERGDDFARIVAALESGSEGSDG